MRIVESREISVAIEKQEILARYLTQTKSKKKKKNCGTFAHLHQAKINDSADADLT